MGEIENATQELESNIMEHQKASENPGKDPKCEHLIPYKHNMDCVRLATGIVEENKATGAEDVEKEFVLVEESIDRAEGRGISQNLGLDELEPTVENLKSVAENLEVPSQNVPMSDNVGLYTEATSVNAGSGKLKSEQTGEANGSVHFDNYGMGSSKQTGKRNTKLKVPVTNSWSLRSKSQEKVKAPEPSDPLKEDKTDAEKKKKRRKKKQMKKNTVTEFSRTRSHLRYLLHRIKFEQSLIDAYSAEGWKGQSLEKLKPEKELQRAKSHIISYKLKIRALFQRLDQSLAVGKLPASLFDSEGEIDSEDIFCAKCGSKDLMLDNDIILCDGICERGFHQFCLDPPLLKEDIPPGDEGWLCPECDCKVDCIDVLKDFQGTKISLTDGWEKIFPEAAAAASGKKLHDGFGSSSDDSEDDDYDPDKPDSDDKVEEDEACSDESNYYSASDDLATNNDKCMELPSDDSEDDDFDPSAPNEDKEVKQDSSSSDFTSDSEDLGALLEDATAPDKDSVEISPSSDRRHPSMVSKEERSKLVGKKRQPLKDELSYLMETGGELVSDRRHVERLDYKKLNDETYGNSTSDSSDEDFDDTTARKRRRTSRENSAAESPDKIPVTKGTSDIGGETQKEGKYLSRRTRKHNADVTANESAKGGSSSVNGKKSTHNRLGEAVTQRLYASFNENQYPERAVKEKLAEELGLKIWQVSKWFENARWSFRHKPQMESKLTVKHPAPQVNAGTDVACFNQSMQPQDASENAAENHTSGVRVEHSVTITSAGNSGTSKSRKRKGKLNHAPGNVKVTQNVEVSMQSPQLRSSTRRTRRGDSVA